MISQIANYAIRPANAADSRFLYELSMDPRIRANSTRSDEFSFEAHERWYARKLRDGRNAIWIMEVPDGVPVAQVRYGRRLEGEGDDAEIAISVMPSARYRGHGLRLLEETMPMACEWLKVRRLMALVLRLNYPSRRLFRRAGFRYAGVECRRGKIHARYEWRPRTP